MTTWMDSAEIRKTFLRYFKEHGHTIVKSSSLIPGDDPTLLFTNAGMVQFKEVFLGNDERPYNCAVTAQLCVRAGGKHNDLENVGHTKRHHTFFEMLGNFSFGAYFKREAIAFAWNLLTRDFGLPVERLWVTVYRDDQESEAIWLKEMKIDPARFVRCGEKDNFWSMGDTGPCGPCTEIFYDHGPDVAGGPPGSPDEDGDRYVEIWNLVFMQYNRDMQGVLTPLPQPCVDTGMGLERIAAVMQGVHDNYDIDLFQHLLKALSQFCGEQDFSNPSMRVVVDHIRSTSFLIAHGVTPSNEGRGYVLRRILRRAVRHGYQLGINEPFLYKLVPALVEIMGEVYPELVKSQTMIEQIIEQEEQQFATTLSRGLKVFDQAVAELRTSEIPGNVVFQLYDTYGFPPDLTADIARERELTLDYAGFNAAMTRQREQSQKSSHFSLEQTEQLHISTETEFTGYDIFSDEGQVSALLQDNKPVSRLEAGQTGVVVLDRTPFYAESGGQIGDSGYLYFDYGSFRVRDTTKQSRAYLHHGEVVKGSLKVNDKVRAEVDPSRQDTVLNHSATHLLHEALRRVLGEHVVQKGSLVEPKRLRFDFSHPKPLTEEQIRAVERLVNAQIRANLASHVDVTTIEEAKKSGAMALFGEKYAEQVRVVTMGNFSKEVCGGTHVHRSGDIGLFKIINESACAAGVRRIEALTGAYALMHVEKMEDQVEKLRKLVKAKPEDLATKAEQLVAQNAAFAKELTRLKQMLATRQSGNLADSAKEIHGFHILALELKEADRDTLRNTLDHLKQQLKSAAVVLATVKENSIQMVAGVSSNCLPHFSALDLLNHVAMQVGGKGGGRPDFAQGGGNQPENLSKALQSVYLWVEQQIGLTTKK